jgi:hypothetical protein
MEIKPNPEPDFGDPAGYPGGKIMIGLEIGKVWLEEIGQIS